MSIADAAIGILSSSDKQGKRKRAGTHLADYIVVSVVALSSKWTTLTPEKQHVGSGKTKPLESTCPETAFYSLVGDCFQRFGARKFVEWIEGLH
jgi:hypothetical protein